MKTSEFLAQVQADGGLGSRKEAERWSRAVLTALAELAPDPETRRQFITQLPGSLKRYLLALTPRPLVMDREALIQHVGAALDVHAPEARRALGTVYAVVRRAVSPGELEDFEARLPEDIAAVLGRVGRSARTPVA
jgi:uncharacterized protein (DUF2267 family)